MSLLLLSWVTWRTPDVLLFLGLFEMTVVSFLMPLPLPMNIVTAFSLPSTMHSFVLHESYDLIQNELPSVDGE